MVFHGVVTVAAALATGGAAPLPSQVPVRTLVPNAPVKAIVRVGDIAYVGGDFTRIGPASGSGVVLDAISGVRDARWPAVAGGEVRVAVSDGSGGWYIAGDFSHVGRIPRTGNDTILSAFACSSRSARGWPISTLLLDEAAHFLTETDGPQTAEKVWEALVPSTAQFPEARIIVASTPYGEDGLFPRLFKSAANNEVPDMVAQHATTEQCNPTITSAFLAVEQARDPDSFEYEYNAAFLGGGAAYLNEDIIGSAVVDRGELPPQGPS